jgi:hypothetical protein
MNYAEFLVTIPEPSTLMIMNTPVNTNAVDSHRSPGRRGKISGMLSLLFGLSFCTSPQLLGQSAAQNGESPDIARLQFQTKDPGPNQRTHFATDAEGKILSQYTEMASGLMRQLEDGSWVECSPEIELFNNGAIARKTRHHVIFSPDSDDVQGVFDVMMPDQKRLRGRCIGMAFTETGGTRKSAFFAEIRNVTGELVGDTEVVYRDCFSGTKGSIRYKNSLGSFQQNIVLESDIPKPADLGFADDANVNLEIWTELLDAPDAEVVALARHTKTGDPVDDCEIRFGEMRIGVGTALPFGEADGGDPMLNFKHRLPIQKAYQKIADKWFIIEQVPYRDVSVETAQLAPRPEARLDRKTLDRAFAAMGKNPGNQPGKRLKPVSLATVDGTSTESRHSTSAMIRTEPKKSKTVAMNKRTAREEKKAGYMLDFDLTGGTQTDFRFEASVTYYVSGRVTMEGTTVFEGGSVIKYSSTNSSAIIIDTTGVLDTQTDAYRPAIFCAMDDNTVGDTISGSTGTPSGYYDGSAIVYYPSYASTMSNLRFKNLYGAIYIGDYHGAVNHTMSHVQFVDCDIPIVVNSSRLLMRNVLLSNCGYGFWSVSTDFHGENVTLDQISNFEQNYGGLTYAFTNSIFCNPGTIPSGLVSSYNVTNNTSTDLFQQIGAAKHYLNDAYRNIGTTNINTNLLADLKLRTTYPPNVLSNKTFSSAVEFSPAVQRDTDIPDVGYHYDPIDWALKEVYVTNATVTILAGTALAIFQESTSASDPNGLGILSGATLNSLGTVSQPVHIFTYDCVQEQSRTNWHYKYRGFSVDCDGGQANFAFTQFDTPTDGYDQRYHLNVINGASAVARHSELLNGGFYTLFAPLSITNCWFHGANLILFDDPSTTFENCTFHRGIFDPYDTAHNLSVPHVTNSLFDQTTVNAYASTNSIANYNSYQSGYGRLVPNGANDLVLSYPMAYGTGPFGRHYQTLTDLVNHGSSSATNFGLYHFTSQSPGTTKETNSVVDIGYHYVTANGSGNPVDTDGDGVPDYIEDANGNGTVDSGETDWTSASDLGLQVWITRPRSSSNIP